MNIWILLLIFFGISAICCAIGFKKFVYFLSIGYGFSVAGLGISYLVYSIVEKNVDWIIILQAIVFIAYGARLSGFLLYREIKNQNYSKVLKEATQDEKKMPFFVLFTIWISVAALYVMQTSPMFFRIYNHQTSPFGSSIEWKCIVLPCIGILISIIGLIIETLADTQKSAQKLKNPNMVATKGLYKMVRCPNYFGEILFWTGVFVGGILVYRNAMQWILSVFGYICIVYIMISGAKRLEIRQEKRYGENEEYRKYADHTPIIFPLIPIYHIAKRK